MLLNDISKTTFLRILALLTDMPEAAVHVPTASRVLSETITEPKLISWLLDLLHRSEFSAASPNLMNIRSAWGL